MKYLITLWLMLEYAFGIAATVAPLMMQHGSTGTENSFSHWFLIATPIGLYVLVRTVLEHKKYHEGDNTI